MKTRIVVLTTKGGEGKSVLCMAMHYALVNAGKTVRAHDIDPQQHYISWVEDSKVSNQDDADFAIYDTTGASTTGNEHLVADSLEAAKHGEQVIFVIPFRVLSKRNIREVLTVYNWLKQEVGNLAKIMLVPNAIQYDRYPEGIKRMRAKYPEVTRFGIQQQVAIGREKFDNRKAQNQINRLLSEMGVL